jgi:sigma-54 dependent transcriptional regulator, acetoin dehydrogenase operon transcriptional activator AcoR
VHGDGLLFPIHLQNGARMYARISNQHEPHSQPLPKPQKRQSAASLDMLNTGDPQLALAIQQVKQVLNRDIPILIQGETGVGKELFARAIHEASQRQDQAWVAVNCAAMPENLIEAELFGYEEGAYTGAKRKGNIGKIQQANGGTLFLDEIGDMPLSLQARLLRVLQERCVTPLGSSKSIPVDFALISATNQTLKNRVAEQAFRSDLYYRINGLSVHLPTLKQRTDLPKLIETILQIEHASGHGISAEVMALFAQHPWPGNVRQLHNVLRTAIALADGQTISKQHLTPDFLDEMSLLPTKPTEQAQKQKQSSHFHSSNFQTSLKMQSDTVIRQAMQHHAGNISAVAKQLGVSRTTLYRKLKQFE